MLEKHVLNSCFKHPNKYGFCKILNNHFNIGQCKVNIIEKMYLYGLIDVIGDEFKGSNVQKPIVNRFPLLTF